MTTVSVIKLCKILSEVQTYFLYLVTIKSSEPKLPPYFIYLSDLGMRVDQARLHKRKGKMRIKHII